MANRRRPPGIMIMVMVMVMMEDDCYGCGDAGDDVGGGESGSQGQ